jgi:hypothetical protein
MPRHNQGPHLGLAAPFLVGWIPTHDPLSSPALSLDRLRDQYGQSFFKAVMISSADRNHFLDDVAQRAGLQREGDRLVRV